MYPKGAEGGKTALVAWGNVGFLFLGMCQMTTMSVVLGLKEKDCL